MKLTLSSPRYFGHGIYHSKRKVTMACIHMYSNVSLHVYIHRDIIHLPICPSTHLSNELCSAHLLIKVPFYPSIHPSTLSFLNPSVRSYTHYLPIHHLSTHPSFSQGSKWPVRVPSCGQCCGWEVAFGELRQSVFRVTGSSSCCCLSLQVCEPSLSGNITAFALKARVVYPINQKFRVSTQSSIHDVYSIMC